MLLQDQFSLTRSVFVQSIRHADVIVDVPAGEENIFDADPRSTVEK